MARGKILLSSGEPPSKNRETLFLFKDQENRVRAFIRHNFYFKSFEQPHYSFLVSLLLWAKRRLEGLIKYGIRRLYSSSPEPWKVFTITTRIPSRAITISSFVAIIRGIPSAKINQNKPISALGANVLEIAYWKRWFLFGTSLTNNSSGSHAKIKSRSWDWYWSPETYQKLPLVSELPPPDQSTDWQNLDCECWVSIRSYRYLTRK